MWTLAITNSPKRSWKFQRVILHAKWSPYRQQHRTTGLLSIPYFYSSFHGRLHIESRPTYTYYTAGPGVQGLDPQKVHICADIEFAWPVENWSRTCVSLQDLVRAYFSRAINSETVLCACSKYQNVVSYTAYDRALASPLKTAVSSLGSQEVCARDLTE